MTQKDFFSDLIRKIEAAGISYMVTGSFASSYHGEPRASNDVDIIIAPSKYQLEAFISSLGSDFYVDSDTAKEALNRQSIFNIIDCLRGWKADLIIRKQRPFSREEFCRRIQGTIAGIQVAVVSPEDIILSKLEWAKKGKSQLQFRDALGVASIQFRQLNTDYLSKWAIDLKIDQLLNALLEQAGLLQPPT